jgi:threonine/homoserine/homoserine lactone efflux protein
MLPLPNLLTFMLAAAVLIAIPGPSVLFVISRSLAYGRIGGLLSVLGNNAGVLVQVIAVSLGIGAILAASTIAFMIVKFVGAAYLVYLGIQTIRHRKENTTAKEERPRRSARRLFAESFLVGITNPKVAVFFVAALPQFVDYSAGAVPLQLLELGGVFLLIGLAFDGTWALAAGTGRDWFARSPKRVERLRATGGVMMIGLGGVLALSGNKT